MKPSERTPEDSAAEVAVDIAANLARVQERIDAAAHRVGRDPNQITLVAVSKTKPLSMVQAALAAGQRDFGENRLEEAWEKVTAAQELGLSAIRWHMIGTIQSRKTAQTVGPFVLVHSVDRVKIARRMSDAAQEAQRLIPILLEVNISGEAHKHGFEPQNISQAVAELAPLAGIQIQGLMTMAPLVDDPEAVRPLFRRLRQLRERLQVEYPQIGWQQLSMGMTNDFEVAVEEGATLVRVGSAIFGARE